MATLPLSVAGKPFMTLIRYYQFNNQRLSLRSSLSSRHSNSGLQRMTQVVVILSNPGLIRPTFTGRIAGWEILNGGYGSTCDLSVNKIGFS